MNEKERLLSFLGIARKAQRLSMGADAAKEAMQKGKARLVLLAGDLSPRSERNARAAAEEYRTPVLSAGVSMDEIACAVGKRTGILAVNDAGFADKLRAMLENAAPQGTTEEVDSIDV